MKKSELEAMIRECVNESNIVLTEDQMIQIFEYAANQKDVDDFNDAISMVKYICNYYINIIKVEEKVLKDVSNRCNSAKTTKDLQKLSADIKNKYPLMTQKAYADIDRSKAGTNGEAFKKLTKMTKKFSIKYSDTVMEQKKQIAAELDKLEKQIITIGDKWLEKTKSDKEPVEFAKMQKGINNIDSIDSDITGSICNNINELYKLFRNEVIATLNDVYGTKKYLKLEKENGIIYKVVNKLVKTKK